MHRGDFNEVLYSADRNMRRSSNVQTRKFHDWVTELVFLTFLLIISNSHGPMTEEMQLEQASSIFHHSSLVELIPISVS